MPHIAVLGSLFLPTTLAATGGTEVWTALFLEEGLKKGYTFDLFGSEGSLDMPGKINLHALTQPVSSLVHTHPYFTTYIKEHPFFPEKEYVLDYALTLCLRMQHYIIEHQDEYDFIIDNTCFVGITTNWHLVKKPVIALAHLGETAPNISMLQLFDIPKNVHIIFPADYQYKNATWIPKKQKSYIPHGIKVDNFTFSPTSFDSLTWVGRITPEKGLEDAIMVASSLKKELNVYGYRQFPDYFASSIKPLLTSKVNFIEDNFQHKHNNQCKAFLMPIHWEEAFGLATIEALACGTPVIAYARGALPEIIEDGVTGFLVNASETDKRGDFLTKATGVEGLIEATQKLYALSPEQYAKMRLASRSVVEEKYAVAKMINSYDHLFKIMSTS